MKKKHNALLNRFLNDYLENELPHIELTHFPISALDEDCLEDRRKEREVIHDMIFKLNNKGLTEQRSNEQVKGNKWHTIHGGAGQAPRGIRREFNDSREEEE